MDVIIVLFYLISKYIFEISTVKYDIKNKNL